MPLLVDVVSNYKTVFTQSSINKESTKAKTVLERELRKNVLAVVMSHALDRPIDGQADRSLIEEYEWHELQMYAVDLVKSVKVRTEMFIWRLQRDAPPHDYLSPVAQSAAAAHSVGRAHRPLRVDTTAHSAATSCGTTPVSTPASTPATTPVPKGFADFNLLMTQGYRSIQAAVAARQQWNDSNDLFELYYDRGKRTPMGRSGQYTIAIRCDLYSCRCCSRTTSERRGGEAAARKTRKR